ncbi:hypothetical protein SAMN04488132_103349 [Sediminibacterium ginsengisoli]|uniref:Uncharacterized protein n=1 Tax=Sediminibacterium ginsengisoli TaxID=413434 RepID=A0A1T4MEP5_9BACT|nr:hypothetical protein SAMN04488132_103349 [Sediminibacterium ginsengisoli]
MKDRRNMRGMNGKNIVQQANRKPCINKNVTKQAVP